MKLNVGGTDRIVRILAGLIILGVGFYYKSWWGLIGLGPLLSGTFRFCPGYLPFGWNSARAKTEPKT